MEMIKVGPYGGQGRGTPWDDQGKNRITQIFISYDSTCIKSIQTAYFLTKEKQLLSDKHGGNGEIFKTVDLDYPDEFITGISGHYSQAAFALRSLTFETNKRNIGPFGVEQDTRFSVQMGTKQSFAGFYGSSDSNSLYSIGVYLKPHKYIISMDEYLDMLNDGDDEDSSFG